MVGEVDLIQTDSSMVRRMIDFMIQKHWQIVSILATMILWRYGEGINQVGD